jgi:hypothetical protein
VSREEHRCAVKALRCEVVDMARKLEQVP